MDRRAAQWAGCSPGLGCQSLGPCEEEKGSHLLLTPFEKVTSDMRTNEKVKHELIVGKRIGFYQLHGKIEKVAIKILDKKRLDAKTWQLFSCEVLSMERLHHPNIIRLYEVLETHHRLHLVLEYAGGGELFTKIGTWGRLSEHEAKLIFIQIVSAVKHMHENNVVHRDLKAENIFYSSKNCVKVGDFGFSALCIQDQLLTTCCGSPPYAAPELFREKNYMGIYVDTWALGVLLYFMVTANMPFRADTVRKLRKTILMGSYTIPAYVSDACQSLIRAILQPPSAWPCAHHV
uniref:non-specific serine/threonine protein kinase n=1 Tax=Callorhinchus milii TaxID=7868 RepID=A0A4W3IAK9_CALMI